MRAGYEAAAPPSPMVYRRARPEQRPVVASSAAGMPPPGPDFLAEAERTLDIPDGMHEYDAANLVERVRRGEEPPDALGEAWAKQARSASEKQQEQARKKAARYFKAVADIARAGLVASRLTELYRGALYDPDFALPVRVKGSSVRAGFVPGHVFSPELPFGPQRADVLVVGKHPGHEEVARQQNFVGKASEPWHRAVGELGAREEVESWYVTNLVKHPNVDPASERLPKDWVRNCLPLLHAEVRLVRPKFILCLGSDAATELLGQKVKVTEARNQVFEFPVPGPDAYLAKAMVIPHPAASFHDPSNYDDFRDCLSGFLELMRTGTPRRQRITERKHVNVYKERHLASIVDDLIARGEDTFAVDCEWEGEYYEPSGWLRTIQFAPRAGEAYVVVLRHQGGVPAFVPGEEAARAQLRRLFAGAPGRRVRVGGHFFRADLPWLIRYGLDLREQFKPPETAEATKWAGGFDTAYALHSIWETGRPFELETWAVKLLGASRYDRPLNDWIAEDCKARKVKKADITGYGHVPDEYLLGDEARGLPNYAALDVDVTRELWDVLNGVGDQPGYLDQDKYGLDSRAAFLTSQRASLAFLEIEMRGMLLDRDRVDRLVEVFAAARAAKLSELRDAINWPGFNPDSINQVRELLFGEEYNGTIDKETGRPRRLRPAGDPETGDPPAITLGLTPIKTSGKRSKMWEDIDEDEEELYRVAADKEVLGILGHESTVVKLLRDVKFLGQVLKMPLRLPERGEDGGIRRDAAGRPVYDGGITKYQASDGRVRTRLYPVETGRCSSSSPNLQNYCVDATTEFLTPQGWVRADALVPEMRVAQFWPETGAIDFAQPTELIRQRYRGDMLHIHSDKQFDQLVTPDHRCLFRSKFTQRWRVRPASEWMTNGWVPVAGVYVGGAKSLSAAQVAWLCAVQADGHYDGGRAINFTFTKERKKQRLREALVALGVGYKEAERKTYTEFSVNGPRNAAFVAWTKEILGPGKCFGSWLLDYDRDTLDLFAAEVLCWDASANRNYLSTGVENRTWVQILWALSGRRAHTGVRPLRAGQRAQMGSVTTTARPRNRCDASGAEITRVPWDGYVYCVSVPSQFVMTRRNGRIVITGNSSRREDDYKKLLGADYTCPTRAMFKAAPGHVIIKTDIKSAELMVAAQLAQDANMIADVSLAMLPEDDPRYVDMHSRKAVEAFQLDCAPTKKALADAGHKAKRVAAKNQVFGYMYGRGIVALCRQCREEGAVISEEEMAALNEAFEKRCAGTVGYLERCGARAMSPGHITNPFGRHRRAGITDDRGVQGEITRQFRNFVIQSTVADFVSTAMHRFYEFREAYRGPHTFHFLLQLHDELDFEVPVASLEWFVDEVLPLVRRIPVPVCDLDGRPISGAAPFYLDVDMTIYEYWGQALTADDGRRLGIPARFLGGSDD